MIQKIIESQQKIWLEYPDVRFLGNYDYNAVLPGPIMQVLKFKGNLFYIK